MIARNIVSAVVLFCIVSFGILYGIPKIIPMEMAEAYAGFATPTLAYGLAVVLSGGYLVLSYRKAYSQTEIPQKKYEFYYASFDEEQKKILEAMTEEDKRRFVDEYEKVASEEKKRALTNNLFDWTHGFIPKGLKPVRTVVKLLMVGCIAWTGFAAYEALEPSYEVYSKAVFEPIPDGIYQYEGLPPIDLHVASGDKTYLKRDIDNILKTIKESQPAFLLEQCNIIHIYNSECYDSIKPAENVTAFADYGDNSITLNLLDSGVYQPVITHELSHLFDNNHGISYRADVNSLYQKYYNKLRLDTEYGYASTNIDEFFAVMSQSYFHFSDDIQSKYEEIYNFFDTLYKPYMA